MRSERPLLASAAGLLLVLAANEGQARSDCDAERALTLEVVADPTASAADALERSVIAELGASQIAVCAVPPPARALPRLQIRASGPDWQRAEIRLESAGAPALERDLDVTRLPLEARPLAIASATDELLRSALDPWGPAAAPPAELDRAGASPATSEVTPGRPRVELGVGVGGSSYPGQRQSVEEELLARYWLRRSLPVSVRLGLGQRLSRPDERGPVQPGADFHGALGAGFVLWERPGRFELLGQASVQLSRVAFDERVTLVERARASGSDEVFSDDVLAPLDPDSIDTPRPVQRSVLNERSFALDAGWALAANLGLEGRVRTGPLGWSLSLAALLPLVPARSDLGDRTSLDTLGVQARAGVWIALDSSR